MSAAIPFYGVPGKMTRRLAAVVIATQGVALFLGALVARAIAEVQETGAASSYLVGGLVLAVLCLLCAGLLRFALGVTLGWLLQLATLVSAVVVAEMLLVGLVFGALWITALVQGHKMDELTRRYLAAQDTGGSR